MLNREIEKKIKDHDTQLELKAKQVDLEIEKARINNLVANAGNTDGNSELLDTRIGLDGVTYPTAGEAVRNQIKNVSDDVKKVAEYSINIFNKNTIESGKFIDPSTGNLSSVSDWNASEYININSISTLRIILNEYNKYCHYAFYDSSKIFISGGSVLSKGDYGQINRPTNAIYIRVSMLNKDVFMLIDNKYYIPDMTYVSYGAKVNGTNILEKSIPLQALSFKPVIENNVVVEVGIGKQFTTFNSALDYVKSQGQEGIIKVYEGIYNVFEGKTQSDLEGATPSFIGLEVANIEVVGIGDRDKIIIKGLLDESITVTLRDKVSTFNIKGNVKFKNCTIAGENIRYTIHDDYEEVSNCIVEYEDCRITGMKNSHNNVYGAGVWNNTLYKFTNCIIEADPTCMCFGFHNIQDINKAICPSKIICDNCTFITQANYCIDFGTLSSKYKDVVVFNNCSFSAEVRVSGANCNFEILGSGNSDLLFRDRTTNTSGILKFSDTTNVLINTGTTKILKGQVVKRKGFSGCDICLNADIPIGIALQDIEVNGKGYVQNKGILPFGLISCSTGNSISNSNGTMVVGTTNAIGKCIIDGYIKLNI